MALAIVGAISFLIAMLPWLGLGGYYFGVPGWNIALPRLHLIEHPDLYHLVAEPVSLLGLVPPLGAFVYFQGEGVVTVRPFAVFVFYALCSLLCLWLAFRDWIPGMVRKQPDESRAKK